MKTSQVYQKFQKITDKINTSFWFVPMACIFMAFIALSITHQLDRARLIEDWWLVNYIYSIDPVGARTVLSTIASAVITVTSIAFSMIVVSLTLASSQFGPRLLRTFMQDRKTQLALGIFVSTFIYCLVLIRFVSIDDKSPFVPGVGLSFALLLTIVSIFMLVYLIHHVATSIQADSVVDNCWRALEQDVQRILPEELGNEEHEAVALDWSRAQNVVDCISKSDGYIQLVDYEGLADALTDSNSGLTFNVRPGDYVIRGQVIGQLHYGDAQNESVLEQLQVHRFLVIGSSRTPIQDPEFTVNQLVEVALRALSPSVNDPFTAIACLDRIGSALSLFACRSFPSSILTDAEGIIRIHRKTSDFESIVECSCNQIRQASLSHPSVIIAFFDTLLTVVECAPRESHKEALVEQGSMLLESAHKRDIHSSDLEDISQRFQRLRNAK